MYGSAEQNTNWMVKEQQKTNQLLESQNKLILQNYELQNQLILQNHELQKIIKQNHEQQNQLIKLNHEQQNNIIDKQSQNDQNIIMKHNDKNIMTEQTEQNDIMEQKSQDDKYNYQQQLQKIDVQQLFKNKNNSQQFIDLFIDHLLQNFNDLSDNYLYMIFNQYDLQQQQLINIIKKLNISQLIIQQWDCTDQNILNKQQLMQYLLQNGLKIDKFIIDHYIKTKQYEIIIDFQNYNINDELQKYVIEQLIILKQWDIILKSQIQFDKYILSQKFLILLIQYKQKLLMKKFNFDEFDIIQFILYYSDFNCQNKDVILQKCGCINYCNCRKIADLKYTLSNNIQNLLCNVYDILQIDDIGICFKCKQTQQIINGHCFKICFQCLNEKYDKPNYNDHGYIKFPLVYYQYIKYYEQTYRNFQTNRYITDMNSFKSSYDNYNMIDKNIIRKYFDLQSSTQDIYSFIISDEKQYTMLQQLIYPICGKCDKLYI